MCQRLQILVEEKGGVVKEVGERIAKASRAFGILKKRIPTFPTRQIGITKLLFWRSSCMGQKPGPQSVSM